MINPATLSRYRAGASVSLTTADTLATERLTNNDQAEVLEFLRERPLHTAVMSGLINDNGIESALNRGSFYGCRGTARMLRGVALIGHAIFLEVRCHEALGKFARLAQRIGRSHMIMGEQKTVEQFWECYADRGQPLRHVCREVLWELNEPPRDQTSVSELRLANPDDLAQVVPVHAALAMEESGINPLDCDPDGFRSRCRRRVDQGRVWVLLQGGELIFKADVISESADVIYIEGIYVRPNHRRRGQGSRCVAEMSRHLLRRSKSISLLVNERRHAAQRCFQKLGFVSRAGYDTIFLQARGHQ